MDYKPVTDEEVARIKRETRARNKTEPRATAATYDAATGNLMITMRGGATLGVPVSTFKALSQASPQQLATVFVGEGGAALFWDELDVQIGIIALLQIVFQVKTVQSVGQQGGRARSEVKAAAVRTNGAKRGTTSQVPARVSGSIKRAPVPIPTWFD